MNKHKMKLMFGHVHYIPYKLQCLSDIETEWVIVPEFYPDLLYSYYGILDYCTSVYQFVDLFLKTHVSDVPHFFSIENIRMLETYKKLRKQELRKLKSIGVCSVQLYHHGKSDFFDKSVGITAKGKELLKLVEAEKIALDLSHLNDWWINEILQIFSGKVLVSHCAVSELLENSQYRSNAISMSTMEKLVERDALIGICFVNDVVSVKENEQNESKVYNDIIKQFEYIGHRIGYDNLCMGPDFSNMEYYSRVYAKNLFIPQCFYTISGYKNLYNDLIDSIGNTAANNIIWENAHKWYLKIYDSR